MPKALEPAANRTREIEFKLDRFELVGSRRLELSGRWFGVRGRRFFRPALTCVADGRQRRLLADLEDKPWAAEDGEPWQASFPCELDWVGVVQAEVTVAPDITIALTAPARVGPERPSRRRPESASATGERARREPNRHAEGEQRAPSQRQETTPRRELIELTRALERERAAKQSLQSELAQSRAEHAHATARVDRLVADLEAAEARRDDADRVREEAIAERNRAERTRDHALVERVEAQDALRSELSEARAAHAHAIAERDVARRLHQQAITELEEARGARDHAVAEREALTVRLEQLTTERSEEISGRGAALVMRNAIGGSGAMRADRYPRWLPVAIIAVIAIVLALALLLRVV